MAEPDFDLESVALSLWNDGDCSNMAHITEQLRQVWNARGAADLEAVNDVAHTNEQAIERAIRNVDR